MAADISILAALLAGLLSFLSPCVLPLVPPYMVYLAGTSLERFADEEPESRVRWETVAAACLFVAGFSTVFVLLGASASAFGSLILHEITPHRIEQFKRDRLAGKWRGKGYTSAPKPVNTRANIPSCCVAVKRGVAAASSARPKPWLPAAA